MILIHTFAKITSCHCKTLIATSYLPSLDLPTQKHVKLHLIIKTKYKCVHSFACIQSPNPYFKLCAGLGGFFGHANAPWLLLRVLNCQPIMNGGWVHLTYMQCMYYILSVTLVSTRTGNGSKTINTKLTLKKLNFDKKGVSRCKRISICISSVILAKGQLK